MCVCVCVYLSVPDEDVDYKNGLVLFNEFFSC